MNWIDNHAVAGRNDPIGMPIGDPKLNQMMSEVAHRREPQPGRNNGWVGARVELFQLRQDFWRHIVRQITSWFS